MNTEMSPSTTVRPVDLRDYVDFTDEEARQVRVYATGTLAVDLWCVQPRQSTPVVHQPSQDITYTVVGGRAWFVTDQGEVGLDALGSMLVPSGVVHGIDNRAPDPLIVMAVSSPPSQRPDDEPAADDAAAVVRSAPSSHRLRRAWEALLGTDRTTATTREVG
ncbi:MAG: hypothetical protein WD007_03935 [Nitriliruptoraceae bacterium]